MTTQESYNEKPFGAECNECSWSCSFHTEAGRAFNVKFHEHSNVSLSPIPQAEGEVK